MKSRAGVILRSAIAIAILPLTAGSTYSTVLASTEPVAQDVAIATTEVSVAANAIAPVETPQNAVDEVFPQRAPHTGVDTNLFGGHAWYTAPPPPPQREMIVAPVKRAPTAPPLPYKLLGIYEQEGSPTMYFLVKGDRTYDVTIGDTLENTYSIDSVTDDKLMFTYLPLKTSQGLRLGEQR